LVGEFYENCTKSKRSYERGNYFRKRYYAFRMQKKEKSNPNTWIAAVHFQAFGWAEAIR